MGFRRYLAPNAREAMERIRKELGPEAVILSNRRSGPGRVEIIAAAPNQMRALVDELEPAPAPAPSAKERAAQPPRLDAIAARRAGPESFQEFIRRQSTLTSPQIDGPAMYAAVAQVAAKPNGTGTGKSTAPAPSSLADASTPAVFRRRPSGLAGPSRPEPAAGRSPGPAPAPATMAQVAAVPAPTPPAAAAATAATVETYLAVAPGLAVPLPDRQPVATAPDSRVMEELHSLRSVLTDRISNLEARLADGAGPERAQVSGKVATPAKRRAMTRLLMSGFSPELARRIGESAPAALDSKDTDTWLQKVIAQQIRCPAEPDSPLLAPGAVALVGPTGVGKTTTMAKLAARFVVRHGAGAIGLVTLDSYRIGAQEQLRGYGRILGVPVHSAHDAASLRDLLASMHAKRQVLIDTCGMSQRDPRLAEMLSLLGEVRFGAGAIGRVLLINAASHAETLDEVARAWQVESCRGVVLTKIDEAARIGGALDALMRYQTSLLGLTNGQRVPEDWHPGNPPLLAHIALKPFGAAFCLDSEEIQALSGRGALLA